MPADSHFVGLMSGTSLDGVDAALVTFSDTGSIRLSGHRYLPFSDELRQQLLEINASGSDELHRGASLANLLAERYARVVLELLDRHALSCAEICAIGSHGQTVRHRPDLGYTIQLGNSALLAELTGITVISDFRSRDIAAGGQGAPLVPAFHRAVFAHPAIHRVIVNVGGISNLTDLPAHGHVSGFDCGPGNLLMDAWINRHTGEHYDRDGTWASSGRVIPALLQALLAHPYLPLPPPKSTGRDTFHMPWLDSLLHAEFSAVDVQATLLEFSAQCIADAIMANCVNATEIYLCGGGARNAALRTRLQALLPTRTVALSSALGFEVDQVEAAAFAWLAHQTLAHQPGNLAAVTGASGPRILGAIYPA